MAWTAPATQTTNTHMNAAVWNEQVTNNFAFLGTSHDHNGGAGDGAAVEAIRSGTIGIFDAACPATWTQVAAWNNLFIRGAAAYGGTGGATTHTHISSDHSHTAPSHDHTAPNHTHIGPSHTHMTANHTHVGSHKHYAVAGNSGNTTSANGDASASSGTGASAAGTGTSGANAGTLGASGNATNSTGGGASGAANNLPAYIDVVFCKKD